MRYPRLTALTAAAITVLTGFNAARADTILHYTFNPGTYYDFQPGSSNSVSGSFDYDATSRTLSNVNYIRGQDHFTQGVVGSSSAELYFGDTNSSDYDVFEFARPLTGGGTDLITGGYHPAIVVSVGG